MTIQSQGPSAPEPYPHDRCFHCGGLCGTPAVAEFWLSEDTHDAIELDAALNLHVFWLHAAHRDDEHWLFIHARCVAPFVSRLQRDVQDAEDHLEEWRAMVRETPPRDSAA